MNNDFAPSCSRLIGEYWVLWYAISNSYSVVDTTFKTLLDLYFSAKSDESFIKNFSNNKNGVNTPSDILDTVGLYLEDCNKTHVTPNDYNCNFESSQRNIRKLYLINGKIIEVYYDSESVLKTIHPSLAYLTTLDQQKPVITFDIYLKDEHLHLFENEQLITRAPKRDYHRIQGKFIMLLLCAIYEKGENDWLGTLHGSTVTDDKSSILFLGKSGRGKSTLCALLSVNGFNLLADDVSPILSKDGHIYYNPLAISIKKGAFDVLKQEITGFETIPTIEFNKAKGAIKYVPCEVPKDTHYPCKAAILVNYKENEEMSLKNISIKTLLETLVPDSWLSSNPQHAKQFLDWLEGIEMYELTYSDTQSVITKISELFNRFSKN